MFFRGVREFGLLLAPGRLRLTLGMAVASLAVVGFCAGPALAKTKSFTTAGCSTWMVPAGVSRVSIQATGSAGQTVNGGEAAGGSGDVVSGTLSGVSVGQVLDVCVDYGGGSGGPSDGGAGGGASGVALGGDFSVPALVAGGGGGGAISAESGGGAGLPSGGQGAFQNPCTSTACGGGGGTQMTFGGGGAVDPGCSECTAGANGAGSSSAGPGAGGAGGAGDLGGGGGGGGYYGAGGGGGSMDLAGGGGGGSDFCASSLTGATLKGCGTTGTNGTFGTASVVLTYTASPHVCSGSLGAPGVLKGAYPDGVVVKGFCAVNQGKAHVTGVLTVSDGSVLGAVFGMHHSRLVVSGNLVLEKGATALVGCKANPNGTGMACIDDPNQSHPTLASHASVSGNIIAHRALGLIVHNSAIGGSIKDIGGGGGVTCAVPKTGVFAAFKSPVFSDLEDSSVGGDVRMNGLRTCWFGLARDNVKSYVTINLNKTADPDAIEVLANHIGASLSCSNNRHPGPQPKGALPIWDSADAGGSGIYPRVSEPNTVGGSRSGQCVKASPIKLGGPPAAKKF
ncbi:MAG TPA: hypothetical protein VFB39_00180 [Solirubrobacteraceae bacterium]|nr:hypothetical protein [Solirubrobacteraceae bacterium]